MNCERCNVELIHNETNTEVVFCNICGGQFCIGCWYIQRQEEREKEENA